MTATTAHALPADLEARLKRLKRATGRALGPELLETPAPSVGAPKNCFGH